MHFSRDIPECGHYDVVVCGAGPSGTAAALAASRGGSRVLLVECQGQLGGMATSGMVSHWLGGRTADGRWVVGGIFREMATECAARGLALLPKAEAGQKYTPHGWLLGLVHGVPVDPYGLGRYLDETMAEAGVGVLLTTQAVEPVVKEGRIGQVVLFNKSGLFAVGCKAVVDATGDADVAARAGCPHQLGRESDGAMTPVTLEVHVSNVDQEALSQYIHEHEAPRFRGLIRELKERGEWPFDTEIFISVQLTEPGTMMLNTTRVCDIDGTDGASITRGLQQGRQEIHKLIEAIRRHWPGFAEARVKAVAPALGVRETRRIEGAYRLTVEDVQEGRTFDDTIGLSSYGWDLADPRKPSTQPMHGRPKPPFTPIPYRVMVPKGVDNLICPGRSVSVERDVLGPLRVMAPCMAMGEAAGLAAGEVAAEGKAFAGVDVAELRRRLKEDGAILDAEAV